MTSIRLNYTKAFDSESVEWSLQGSIVGDPKINRNILLHKVWLSTDMLNENKSVFDSSGLDEALYPRDSDIADMVDNPHFGKTYVRAVLPSEVSDFHTRESLFEEIRDRALSYLNGTGSHRPFSGYFFFLEPSIESKFMNYDMLEDCANSISVVAKSYSSQFPSVDSIVYPVNSSIYYTYPNRLTVGGQSVVGARAGDIIKFRNQGGSGSYTVTVVQGNELIDVFKGRIRIVKNTSGVAVVQVTDSNSGGPESSTITINVEGVD